MANRLRAFGGNLCRLADVWVFEIPNKKAVFFVFSLKYVFTPNYQKYKGVRPINIYLLRVLYLLMPLGAGTEAWQTIVAHEGPWDHTKAVAWCVWAAYRQ